MKKLLLLFAGIVAIVAMSCTSKPTEGTAVNCDSTVVVIENVDTTVVVKADSCAVDTCKK